MTKAMKLMKWCGISIFTLFVLAVGFYAYLVMSFDDQNMPENHGKVNVELFMGEGKNQPLIVGLGGSEGGNAWASDFWKDQREEFIAQGYSFLAVAYFGEKGVPKNLDRIALDGVHQAIMDASNNSKINEKCIALIGGSKGAELSLLLASYFPDIKTVVAVVPGNAVYPAMTIAMNTPSFTVHGKNLPFVPLPLSATLPLIKGDLRAVWVEMLKDQKAVDKASIPVENINGPLFFLSATNDEMWPSSEMSESMVQRLNENDFPYYFEHLAIEGNHASPLAHFDEIEKFLAENFLKENSSGCSRAS